MTRDVHEAISELKKHPEIPVLVEIDGEVVELRWPHRRTAADIFREVGRWEGDESTEELLRGFRERRDAGGSRTPPKF